MTEWNHFLFSLYSELYFGFDRKKTIFYSYLRGLLRSVKLHLIVLWKWFAILSECLVIHHCHWAASNPVELIVIHNVSMMILTRQVVRYRRSGSVKKSRYIIEILSHICKGMHGDFSVFTSVSEDLDWETTLIAAISIQIYRWPSSASWNPASAVTSSIIATLFLSFISMW